MHIYNISLISLILVPLIIVVFNQLFPLLLPGQNCELQRLITKNKNSQLLSSPGQQVLFDQIFSNNHQKTFIRAITCPEENLSYAVYCTLEGPYRDDIQTNRQYAFQAVAWLGAVLLGSKGCTARIFCEQACLDGVSSLLRADYPSSKSSSSLNLLSSSNEEDLLEHFYQAFNRGEAVAVCGTGAAKVKSKISSEKSWKVIATTRTTTFATASPERCQGQCALAYPSCERERKRFPLISLFYRLSRVGHYVGMFTFDLYYLIREWLLAIGKLFAVI